MHWGHGASQVAAPIPLRKSRLACSGAFCAHPEIASIVNCRLQVVVSAGHGADNRDHTTPLIGDGRYAFSTESAPAMYRLRLPTAVCELQR